jgi:hypothetical protein
MSNSYRIRTQVGVDKSIKVHLEQDFEFLEILSIKILESDIYTRQCSDYGVVIGRISINNGFGVPNCKVSIFVPLSSIDANNPIISELYPYSSVSDLNDLGYRYNLLPYVKSYSNHVPTGSFFDKEDVLLNQSYIEVFDKYYRYTAVTNESGDFMIFGVPLGTQTIHVDIDLSDIGEFSLSPQDLVRTGIANETQVAGTKFRSSSNLNELPQIISINRIITVEPLWGQPEICNIGINRTDFDLSAEANVTIQPTAIFMGSMFSNNDEQNQKINCKPKKNLGEMCNLVAGPGEILAIRQTIQEDDQGRPILEQFDLESGGQVIDDNGTWLVDLPMNLDYITTNEFGERVISDDPEVGIPTKGKYRFKIKWNQSPDLSEPIKRAYFLVPNIREYGWGASFIDQTLQEKSYAFSLDWDDYADSQVAINCDDSFYFFSYNKVYTISQLIDQYKKGLLPTRTIAIKNILNDVCESENVKFPTNDASFRFDLLYFLFVYFIYLFRRIFVTLLIIVHLLAAILYFFRLIFGDYWRKVGFIRLPNLSYPDCDFCECKEGGDFEGPGPSELQSAVDLELQRDSYLTPLWSFSQYTQPAGFWVGVNGDDLINPDGSYVGGNQSEQANILNFSEQLLITGQPYNPGLPSPRTFAPQMQDLGNGKKIFTTSIPIFERLNLFNLKSAYFDGRIPKLFNNNNLIWEPNNFNVITSYNPWGGGNRIRVSFRPTLNGYPRNTNSLDDWFDLGLNTPYHFDNVLLLMVKPEKLSELTAGQVVTFQSPELSSDSNLSGNTLNQFGNTAITGTTINQGQSQITVEWAKFDGTGNNQTIYTIDQGIDDAQYNKYPMDIEYFQVITAMTIGDIYGSNLNQTEIGTFANIPGTLRHALFTRINIVTMRNNNQFVMNDSDGGATYRISPAQAFENFTNQVLVFLVRGVDPYSTRGEVEYDLSGIIDGSPIERRVNNTCGNPNDFPGCIDPSGTNGRYIIRGNNYKLNIPINGRINSTRHFNNQDGFDSDTNQYLYYPSFHYQPSVSSFRPFSSGLPNYYSLLDKSTPYNYLTNGRRLNETSNNSTNSGGSVLRLNPDYSSNNNNNLPQHTEQLLNAFQVEFRGLFFLDSNSRRPILNGDTGRRFGVNYSSPNVYYRSYWSNQIVEGGTYMSQVLCLNGGPGQCTLGPNLDPKDDRPKGVSYYYAPSYLLYNVPYGYTTAMVSQVRIIMRSDRLPTSTSYIQDLENVFPLFSNPRFTVYTVSDDENGNTSFGTSSATPTGSPTFGDTFDGLDDQPDGLAILDTFNCNGMVPLGCYQTQNNEIIVKDPSDPCYDNNANGIPIMDKGCYVLVTVPLVTLINGKDISLLIEWIARVQITFAACRNVWSHMFTNNWINGTLFAFPFKNKSIRTLTDVVNDYCDDTVYLHPTSKNFYYRSSPYSQVQNQFIGSPTNNQNRGNVKNLKFPTTIIDLGPRTNYTQELSLSSDFDGYIMDRLTDTTYKDVSDILNLLIINRFTNTKFLELIIGGGANVLTYFDKRSLLFVDGDYAQMLSINSELGVVDFEASNYRPIGGPQNQDPIYFVNPNSNDAIFGIFYSSDTQVRDFVTPKRTISNPLVISNNNCGLNSFSVFSQEVPFYQWKIENNEAPYNNIFGSQKNDWYTKPISGQAFFKKRYQDLDRLNITSRYFRTNSSSLNRDFKGYIYSFDDSTNELNPNRGSWERNNPNLETITVGAPFYFYFGLKKGKTAWDRFAKEWINFENFR